MKSKSVADECIIQMLSSILDQILDLWNMPNYHKNSKWHPANVSICQPDIGELYACFYPNIVSWEFMIKSCHLAAYCQLVALVCVTSCWCNFWSTSMRLRVVWVAYICAETWKWERFHRQTAHRKFWIILTCFWSDTTFSYKRSPHQNNPDGP